MPSSPDSAQFFYDKGYLTVPQLLDPKSCHLTYQYALLRHLWYRNTLHCNAVPNTHAVYADSLMEVLLHDLTPIIEQKTGLELCPTYSFYRVYKPQDTLARHRDRSSCEVSVTLCLGYDYKDSTPDYQWAINVENKQQKAVAITQNSGDGLIYRGCDLHHWRDSFDVTKGANHAQVFLHYIDKNGPHYPKYKFDKRIGVGAPKLIPLDKT